MPDFSHSLRDAIEADARAHLGAEALPGTRRTIARRRRATAAGYGAGSLLAVGGLAVGGVLLASREDPAPASSVSPTPSPSPTGEAPLAYTTIDLTDEAGVLTGSPVENEMCGQPAPEPASQDGEFSADFTFVGDSTLDQGQASTRQGALARATLEASLDGKLPAFTSDLEGLIVRDGVVVGFLPGGGTGGWTMFSDGHEQNASLEWWGSAIPCDRETDERLAGGDYELMLTIGVTASEREAALMEVQNARLQLLGGELVEVLEPGAYECDRYQDSQSPGILNCDVTALPGTSIDREAGTITIPYQASLYVRDVDARMYSEPIPITLTDFVDDYEEARHEAGEELTAGAVPACGQSYGWVAGGEVALESRTSMGILDAGDTVASHVWVNGTSWREASVELPVTPRAWLLEGYDVPLDDGSSIWALRVVGWMALAAQKGPDVDVTRGDGPQPWPLDVTEVSWCEGVDRPTVDQAVILAEHSVTDESGTRTSSDPIIVGTRW